MLDLYTVAVETKNSALREILENAADLYFLALERSPDDEEVAAGMMFLNFDACEVLVEQDPSERTWELAYAMAYIANGKRPPRKNYTALTTSADEVMSKVDKDTKSSKTFVY